MIGADFSVILTAVEKVCLNFGKENETPVDRMDSKQARALYKRGHFGKGSMLPKVEAGIWAARRNPACKTIITSIEKLFDGMRGITGTLIEH
jgi:carbamate kinase